MTFVICSFRSAARLLLLAAPLRPIGSAAAADISAADPPAATPAHPRRPGQADQSDEAPAEADPRTDRK